jgi:hypothetical protein
MGACGVTINRRRQLRKKADAGCPDYYIGSPAAKGKTDPTTQCRLIVTKKDEYAAQVTWVVLLIVMIFSIYKAVKMRKFTSQASG